jgi:hypothetical protein
VFGRVPVITRSRRFSRCFSVVKPLFPFDGEIQLPPGDVQLQPPPADVQLQPPPADVQLQPPPGDGQLHPPPADVQLQPPADPEHDDDDIGADEDEDDADEDDEELQIITNSAKQLSNVRFMAGAKKKNPKSVLYDGYSFKYRFHQYNNKGTTAWYR